MKRFIVCEECLDCFGVICTSASFLEALAAFYSTFRPNARLIDNELNIILKKKEGK